MARPAPRRAVLVGIGLVLVLGGLAVVASALRGGDGTPGTASSSTSRTRSTTTRRAPIAPTTAPTTPAGLGVGWQTGVRGRSVLRGFGQVRGTITDASGRVCEVCLLAATDEAQRARGLMTVTDPELGGHDGMVFAYDGEVSGAFWMRNTPMPLSIAYFDAAGRFVSSVDMAPCADRPDCRSYPAAGPFAYALEVPAGGLAELGAVEDSVPRLSTRPCPLAAAS